MFIIIIRVFKEAAHVPDDINKADAGTTIQDFILPITSQGHAWSQIPEVLTGNFQWIQIMGQIIKRADWFTHSRY